METGIPESKVSLSGNNVHPYNNGAPINSPSLPFLVELPKLNDGFLICIQGQIWPIAKKCTVQLLSQLNEIACSIELGFDCDQTSVTRNSHLRNVWGQKELSTFSFLPRKKDPVELIILVTPVSFKCSFNGHHAFDFIHRCPLSSVKAMKVGGHLDISRIFFQDPMTTSHSPPKQPMTTSNTGNINIPTFFNATTSTTSDLNSTKDFKLPSFFSSPSQDNFTASHITLPKFFSPGSNEPPPPPGFLPVMFSPVSSSSSPPSSSLSPTSMTKQVAIPSLSSNNSATVIKFDNGLFHGQVITVYARLTPMCRWFKISFRTGEQSDDCSFIFYVNLTEKVIVRNSSTKGVMGPPENQIPFWFPFEADANICLAIQCLSNQFNVAVNSRHYIEFQRRNFSLCESRCVVIEGDVMVSHVL